MIRVMDSIAGLAGWKRSGLAFIAGATGALGLPPLDLWPLLFVGVPCFLVLLASESGARRSSGFGLGWAFGLGYFATAFHWIGFAFLVDAATYLWMMPFMLGILAGGMAIYWGLAALVAKRLGRDGLPLALAFAAAIGAAEWLRGHLFTGFPWAAPGLFVDGMGAVAQVAALIGMTGLTVLIMLWAALPYALLAADRRDTRGLVVILLGLLPLGWGYGAWRLDTAASAMVPGVMLRIVQPNIPQEQKWREENGRAIFDQLKDLTTMPTPDQPTGIGGITHVVWPESAVPFLIDESPVARAELKPLLGGRTTLITGSLRRAPGGGEEPDVFNSVIVFDGDAEPVARYDKWRLVPGGEFLPLAGLLEPLGFRKIVHTPGSFTAGPGPRTIAIPGLGGAALLVCYEAIFPDRLVDTANRPGLLINVTNDGWFGRSTGPYQHLAQARLRTIEQGLPLIRAANTGISAVIDPYGNVLKQLPLSRQGVIDTQLPAGIAPPAYARLGDWWALAIILLCGAGAMAMRAARSG
jgi:apolipoprotein N-acyltransferase